MRILFFCLSLILGSAFVAAQPKWRVYTPANKIFTVELPWNPHYKRLEAHALMMGTAGPFKGINSIETYDFSMYIDEEHTSFVLRVYDLAKTRSEADFDKEVEEIIANSSKPSASVSNKSVVVNGLHGKEYLFVNGKESARILFVLSGHRAYVMQFSTEDKKGVDRGPVNRVFDSFQPK